MQHIPIPFGFHEIVFMKIVVIEIQISIFTLNFFWPISQNARGAYFWAMGHHLSSTALHNVQTVVLTYKYSMINLW